MSPGDLGPGPVARAVVDEEDLGGELGVGDENLLVAVSAVLLIVGLASFAEEVFFRGFVFSGLRSRLTLWPAAVISAMAASASLLNSAAE